MSIKKLTIALAVIAAPIIGLQSCYEVATVMPDNKGSEVNVPVSFSKDLQPLLNANCNMSGCHTNGGVKPNLAADKAFGSLDNGGYLDKGNAGNSSIYLWLTGKKSTKMPPNGPNNPSNINQLVLAWIKQGAQNN
jgi:hypothetical protein